MSATIVAVSAVLQFIAALLSVRLIKVTGRRTAWTLIAFALTLMGVRRSITLYQLLYSEFTQPVNLSTEIIVLIISLLMLSGVILIGPIFRKEQSISKALRKSEERYKQIVEHASDIIFRTDLGGHFTYINPVALRIMGYTEEEVLGEHFTRGIVPSYRRKVALFYLRQERNQIENTYYEYPSLTKGGNEVWLGQNVQLILKNGQIDGFQAVARDITERKLMEDALQEAHDELEHRVEERTQALLKAKVLAVSAMQEKSDFLSTMSHELRSPLNAIIGYSELLREEFEESGDTRFIPDLEKITFSGNHLLSLVNSILDLSKIEAGKMNLEMIPISLIDIIENTSHIIAPNAAKKHIKVITYIDPGIPRHVIGDPVRVSQIIINLCSNAIKFTEKGEIIVRADRLEENNENKITVQFSVIDSGIGIAEDKQKKLFDAFTQAEISTTRTHGGTGLGLSISKCLSEMMGGNIRIKSKLGVGSKFIVTIPFTKSDEEIISAKDIEMTGLRILIVSSHEMEHFVCRRYLEYCNAEVEIYDNLKNSFEYVKAHSNGKIFNIVVLGPEWSAEEKVILREVFAKDQSLAATKFVFLFEGRRKVARVDESETVLLDTNPLKYNSFLSAILIAAGREKLEPYHRD